MQVYKANMINFTANGYTIHPTSAKLSCQNINEVPTLDITVANKERNTDKIERLSVIKFADMENKEKLYRVINLDKDNIYTYITAVPLIYADRTIAKDFTNNDVTQVRCVDMTGQQALDKILYNSPYTGHSDILTVENLYLDNSTIMEGINGSQDNTFIKRWGGEIYLDNYHIYINERIGRDRNFVVAYGKNMTKIKQSEDDSGIITRLIPYNSQNIKLGGKTPWVDSSNINKYPEIYEAPYLFDNLKLNVEGENFNEDDIIFDTVEELRAEMIKRCNEMFAKNEIDVPIISLEVGMADLSKTQEYKLKGYNKLEEVLHGDTIRCHYEDLDIDITSRIVGYEWDVLGKEYISLSIGNVQYGFFDKQDDIANRVNNAIDKNGNVIGNSVKGWMDAYNTGLRASKDIAKKLDYRAFELVDEDIASSTYGSVIGSSTGVYCASAKDQYGNWKYENAITGKGILADRIVAGVINSKTGVMQIDLNGEKINIGQSDGAEIEISKYGIRRKVAGTYFNYFYLNHHTFVNVTTNTEGEWSTTVQLPNEFKGKSWMPLVCISSCNIVSSNVFHYIPGKDYITWSSDWNTAKIAISGQKEAWAVTGINSTDQYPITNGQGVKFQLTLEVLVVC